MAQKQLIYKPKYAAPSKNWVEDIFNPKSIKTLSDEKILSRELQIVRVYILTHLSRNGKKIEDGIYFLIYQYSSPLFIRYVSSGQRRPRQYIEYMYTPSDDNNIKICVNGAGHMGKTCMLIRYTTGHFPDEYIPTVCDTYEQSLEVDGVPINIGLCDTSGDEDFSRLRPLSYPNTDVFLICMSVCKEYIPWYTRKEEKVPMTWNGSTKSEITLAFVKEVRHHCGEDIPICIVGTKTDLRNNPDHADLCWSRLQMKEFAKYECGCNNYIECSSKNNEGVNEVFSFAICRAIAHKKQMYEQNLNKSHSKCCALL